MIAWTEFLKDPESEKVRNIEIAINLLDILHDETIALKTGLSVEKINQLRENNKGK